MDSDPRPGRIHTGSIRGRPIGGHRNRVGWDRAGWLGTGLVGVPFVLLAVHGFASPSPLSAQHAAPSAPPAGGVLQGSVVAHPDPRPRPLSNVNVSVPGGLPGSSALTDRAGRYRIEGLPAGPVTVSFQRVGYRPLLLEVGIPPGDTVTLDVELEVRPVTVAGLVATVVPRPTARPGSKWDPDDDVEVDLRALEAAPGLAEAGLGDAIRSLQRDGVTDPARVLLMRGSTVDQKLMLLDGTPVYAPFHLGGLLRPFDADLLDSATHYVGGAPARYDGGLSYVLDLSTRPGRDDAVHGSAFLDVLGGGASVEGPLGGRGSFLASGRTLHELGRPLLDVERSPFGYGEVLLRGDLRIDRGQRLAVTGFWNAEDVRLDLRAPEAGVDGGTGGEESGAAETTDPGVAAVLRPEEATWGNGALSLRHQGTWDRTEIRTTLGVGRYRADLPLGLDDPAYAAARTVRARATSELERTAGPWRLGVGISAERIDHSSRARVVVDGVVSEAGGRSRSEALAVYAQGARPLGSDFHLTGALRLDHFPGVPGAGGLRVAPRAALAWALSDDAELTISAGRFYQLPRGTELEVGVALGDPGGLSAGHGVFGPAQATHLVLSLEQHLAPDVRLGLDGFVKGFRNLPGAGDDVLRSSGLDLRVRRSGDDLTGWIGYSLAWFWNTGPGTSSRGGTPGGFAATAGDFAGRHLLSAGVSGRFGPGWGARLQASYGNGLPYASVPILSSERVLEESATPVLSAIVDQASGDDSTTDGRTPTLDGFLRVDLELSRRWELTWNGRSGTLRPYLRVINAVSRRDALFHYFDPWRSPEVRSLAQRPLLPLVGAELRF